MFIFDIIFSSELNALYYNENDKKFDNHIIENIGPLV